ncbi:putative phosphatidate phosphatase [Halotydeus destructor]|nr:putative phosphatidate phosphatase [Halotydeus destructor]
MLFGRLATEIVPLLALIAALAYYDQYGKPYKRGFWCNDQTIRYPMKPETVNKLGIAIFALVLPPLVILVFYNKNWSPWRASFWTSYVTLNFPYFFGYGLTWLTTGVIKYSASRLRPYFMDLCRPEPYYSQSVCPDENRYIADYKCSVDLDHVSGREMISSFPSGHSSLLTYAAMYMVLVLQRRLTEDHQTILRLTLQVAAICSCLWAALTRYTDNRHHWQDVAAGICLGAIVAIFVERAFLFVLRNQKAGEMKPIVPYDELRYGQ